MAVLLSGCGSARILVPTRQDATRDEVASLREQVQQLESRNQELQDQLKLAAAGLSDSEVLSQIPVVERLRIDQLSGAEDSDGDGTIDHLVIYVVPEDGRGRFTQIVGGLGATAVLLQGGSPSQTLGLVTLSSTEVGESYRSSFLGTHYVAHLPVDSVSSGDEVLVRVDLQDPIRQRKLGAERRITMRLP